MLKVGITGGIGSGKTTVCRIFAMFDIPVYYADDRAREIMLSDHKVIQKIKNLFGEDVYGNEGLNRKLIAGLAFNNQTLLNQLSDIIHPAVYLDSLEWFQFHQDKPYVLYEAAIMFETGSYKMMDKMITVVAPEEERIERTMKRDGILRDEVLARMTRQWPDEEKIKLSDFVIYNTDSTLLTSQVADIHEQLMALALAVYNFRRHYFSVNRELTIFTPR
jgi:dephospho-CoA kinase